MANFNCFSGLIGRKKKRRAIDFNSALKTLKIRIEHPVKPLEGDETKTGSCDVPAPFNIQKDSIHVKVMDHESPLAEEGREVAYEGGDEHEEKGSMKRYLSDYDLQALEEGSTPQCAEMHNSDSFDNKTNGKFQNRNLDDCDQGHDTIYSGHISDPGIGKAEFWGSPMLKRSCSNLETSKVLRKLPNHLQRSKSQYNGELLDVPIKVADPGSPVFSIMSHGSADRVMLKKHSSSQILPSRSRKLWWKLFLWSHRNLHKPWIAKSQPQAVTTILNQQGGYSSDTLEPSRAIALDKAKSPISFTRRSLSNKEQNNNDDDSQSWHGSRGEGSGQWGPNQWVAFSVESSSFARVNEWVKDLDTQPPPLDNHDGQGIAFPPSPENVRSTARSVTHFTRPQDSNLSEEILHANSVIQSLNSSSTVAHISGISLKAIPNISRFSSLRSVNLSNNLIVSISSGSLPKGIHTLNLSRNKISTIEGLRELTRLRVLDLTYNRISRIGQGLSNCTMIKELYLAGNKISDVEGLHRLLKLTILDLSFNKITTAKALGQLVANYNSLQALNLLGNPIQSNIGDDQLRKAVCSLLPKLVYLNKQPIKPQRAGEVLTDSVAKAALGTSNSWNPRRKSSKRVSTSGSTSSVSHRSRVSSGQKPRSRSKSRMRHHLKNVESAHGLSYR